MVSSEEMTPGSEERSEGRRGGVREGLWDCVYCGTTGVRGRDIACPNCGQVRPDDVTFYLAEDAAEVTDEQLLQRARGGADWVCDYCGTSNEAEHTTCKQCGAPREADATRQEQRRYDMAHVPRSGDNTWEPQRSPEPEEAPEPEPEQKGGIPTFAWVGALLALLVVCGGIFFFLDNRQESMRVDGFAWERSIEVEELRTVTEEDWEVPAGGRVLSESREVYEYEEVIVGYETRTREVTEQVQTGTRDYVCGQVDLGNGFFEDEICTEPIYEERTRTETYEEPITEEQPVYRTRYTYEIDRWETERTEEAAGEDQEPFWPPVELAEDERQGERDELYLVYLRSDDGDSHELALEEEVWSVLELEGRYTVSLGLGGNPDAIMLE